jgi:hypothetical protein
MIRESFLVYLNKILYPFVEIKHEVDYSTPSINGFDEPSSEFFKNTAAVTLPYL